MLNQIFLIGTLGKDPEFRTVSTGNNLCSFRLATFEKWTDKQGIKQEKTSWHNITVWGKQAESCAKYLTKGRKVFIEGKLSYEQYEKDGVKKYITKIIASNVIFLDSNSGNKTYSKESFEQNKTYPKKPMTHYRPFEQEDIPF